MRTSTLAVIVGLSIAASSAAAPLATVSLQAQMKAVVEPASNVLFAVGGEADPANGPPPPVVSDARWREAADAAGQLKAVAADLGPTKAETDWKTYVKQLGDLSDASLKAARAKDGAALSTAVNALADNCTACHAKYKPQT